MLAILVIMIAIVIIAVIVKNNPKMITSESMSTMDRQTQLWLTIAGFLALIAAVIIVIMILTYVQKRELNIFDSRKRMYGTELWKI